MPHRVTLPAALLTLGLAASPLSADLRRGFELSVVVDGCDAPEYEHAGRIYIEALRGRNFSLRVSNPTSERIAVALSVDGLNVVDAKRTSALDATKWVLAPGQTIEVPGWQVSGETSRKFFFTETGRSYARWIGDTRNVGTIEAVFFREKHPPIAIVEPDRPLELRGESNEPLRRAGPPPSSGGSAKSPSIARTDEQDRYAATGIGERTRFPVTWVAFEEDPNPVARVALRYEFRAELVRLGVLRRGDDALAAREKARGFEPRYAPEPDPRR